MQHLKIKQDYDETGSPVELTWDLFPLVEAAETRHLSEDGLPKPGTRIREGMILIGRIGKSKAYDSRQHPSSLEVHGLPLSELRARYGHMWKDYSIYATPETSGVVKSAFLEGGPEGVTAVIQFLEHESDTDESLTLSATGAKETNADDN